MILVYNWISLIEIDGKIRFKENKIVRDLLDFVTKNGFGLNQIAMKDYSIDDREQLHQLIGYSLSGFGELSSTTDETYYTAVKMYDESKNILTKTWLYVKV